MLLLFQVKKKIWNFKNINNLGYEKYENGTKICDKYMFGTFITFFILIFSLKIFEIANLFSKILSLVTQKSISNLFYSNLTLKTLN